MLFEFCTPRRCKLGQKKNELAELSSAPAPVSAPTSTPASVTTSAPVSAPTSTPVSVPAPAPVSVPTPAPVSVPAPAPVAATTTTTASPSLKGLLSREQLQKQAKEQLEQMKQQASTPVVTKEPINNVESANVVLAMEEPNNTNSNNGKPYTPAQRFDVLSKKYPDLIHFTKTLNLDVDW